jgi:hypothetical protein
MSRIVRELTTTSYAILGLLAIRPWSTYELARQMQRDLRFVWPRAESCMKAGAKRDGARRQSRRPLSVGRIAISLSLAILTKASTSWMS